MKSELEEIRDLLHDVDFQYISTGTEYMLATDSEGEAKMARAYNILLDLIEDEEYLSGNN